MIMSYRVRKFLHYLCFWGQGIYCQHYHSATMFERPRNSRSTSDAGGTRSNWWLCFIDFGKFFTLYVFEVKESIADISIELSCSDDLENTRQLPVQQVLVGTDDCLKFFHYSCFWGQGILTFLRSYRIRVTSKIQVNFRFKRYWWFCLIHFHKFFSIHVFEVKLSIADIPTKLPCLGDFAYLGKFSVHELLSMGDLGNLQNRKLFRIFEVPKHSSSIEMSAIDSLTLKAFMLKILRKSIRHNHQYIWKHLEPEVDMGFRGCPNIVVHQECQKWMKKLRESMRTVGEWNYLLTYQYLRIPVEQEVDLNFRSYPNMVAH